MNSELTPVEKRLINLIVETKGCPSPEDLVSFAGSRRPDPEILVHLGACRSCRQLVADLRAAEDAIRVSKRNRWRGWAPKVLLPVSAAGLLLVVFFSTRGVPQPMRPESPIQVATKEPDQRTPIPGVQVDRREIPAAVFPSKMVRTPRVVRRSITKPNGGMTVAVNRAIDSLPKMIQPYVALLAGSPSVVRSDGGSSSDLQLKSPDPANLGISSVQPTFAWNVPAHIKLTIRLTEIGLDGAERDRSQDVTVGSGSARLREDIRLNRGNHYRFSLFDINGQETQWLFRVLSDTEVKTLIWARQHIETRPELAAVIFHEMGLYRDARVAADLSHSLPVAWRESIGRRLAARLAGVQRP